MPFIFSDKKQVGDLVKQSIEDTKEEIKKEKEEMKRDYE